MFPNSAIKVLQILASLGLSVGMGVLALSCQSQTDAVVPDSGQDQEDSDGIDSDGIDTEGVDTGEHDSDGSDTETVDTDTEDSSTDDDLPDDDIENLVQRFNPRIKFRNDNQCWPMVPIAIGECGTIDEFKMAQDDIPVYWEYFYDEQYPGQFLITYWYYYGQQDACWAGIGAHGNDWERITVHIRDEALVHVVYNQHDARYVKPAEEIDLEAGERPISYVGRHAHGNYHDQRSTSIPGWENCFYWKDPRGPDLDWDPPLEYLFENADQGWKTQHMENSENPIFRNRPHEDAVCKVDGGHAVIGDVGIENTCKRNPPELQDEQLKLTDLFKS